MTSKIELTREDRAIWESLISYPDCRWDDDVAFERGCVADNMMHADREEMRRLEST